MVKATYAAMRHRKSEKVIYLYKNKKYEKNRYCSNQNTNSAVKLKLETTKISNSQNTRIISGQPSKQLFPKRLPLSSPNQTKNIMNTRKLKRHQNSCTVQKHATENHSKTSNSLYSDYYHKCVGRLNFEITKGKTTEH